MKLNIREIKIEIK